MLLAQGESVAFCVALRTLEYTKAILREAACQTDKSYQALMLLHMSCAEKSASQANNDIIHQHWDFFAHGIISTPIVRSEIREDFDLERYKNA